MKIKLFRERFRQNYAWLLLLVLFAICFIVPNRTGATNLYRLFIVIPMMLCFRPGDLAEIWANTAARWFLLLCGWMFLSLFWDGLSHRDWQLFSRGLNVLALFYLAFLVCKYQLARLTVVIDGLLVCGLVGAVLIIIDWPGFFEHFPPADYSQSTRGVFNNSIWVGWVMAFLSLVALFRALQSENGVWLVSCVLLAGFFIALTLLARSRGACGILLTGIGLLVLRYLIIQRIAISAAGQGNWRLFRHQGGSVSTGFSQPAVVFALLGVFCGGLMVAFPQNVAALIQGMIARGNSSRYDIWWNAWQAITDSIPALLVGRGLSADPINYVSGVEMAHYHSLFWGQLFHLGVLGLVLYAGAFVGSLSTYWRTKQTQGGEAALWAVVIIAVQIGFIPDGEHLFVIPSAILLCFLLPWFLLIFQSQGLANCTSANSN